MVENNLFKLYDSSWAFEDAIVDTVVFFLDKSVRTSENLIITSNNYVETLVDYSTFLNNPGYKIDFRADQSKKSLLNKMQHGSVSLGSISTTKAGVKLYEVGKGVPPQSKEVVETKPFTSINTQPAGWRPLVRGGDINKYRLNRKNEFVNYGPWLAAPREEEMFKGIRIVIRRTDDVLRATILEDDSVCVNSCHVLIPDNPDHIYAILAILNSKLAQWVFEIQNPQMVGKTFAEIKVVYIENLPIKLPNDLSRFDLIVRSILISNEAQIVTDFSRVENEIDSLVYELYDLSKEEIAVVERSEPKE